MSQETLNPAAEQGGAHPEDGEHDSADAPAASESGDRGRSTIGFPYAGLADAESIAKELHGFGGTAAPDGIAKALGQKVTSGAFRQKLAAARVFGLITTRPGQVALTKLGNQIIDPENRDAARADAFLQVPLYKRIFDEYQGNLLPPLDALEAKIVEWGVSPKQASIARQVFQRSGQLAGFFRRGANRLTLPDVGTQHEAKKHEAPGNNAPTGAADALQTLWLTLLRDGAGWSATQTKEYVDGARQVYAVLRAKP